METAIPFFREQGTGAGVVCLHSNASSSGQWRTLTDLLSNRFTVIAVDGYGAGKSPQWPVGPALRLEDEVRLLDPALNRAGDRFHLVGHSYGAAVAVKAALMQPQRVRSLVLYEPTLFHLVAGADPLVSPAQGIGLPRMPRRRSTMAILMPRPSDSSISGWAPGPGKGRQRCARPASLAPPRTSGPGATRCSTRLLRRQRSPRSTCRCCC